MAGTNFFARAGSGEPPRPDRSALDETSNPAGPATGAAPDAAASAGTGAGPIPGAGTGPRRRGRPPGSGNSASAGSGKPSGKKNHANLAGSIEQLSRTLVFTSMGFAILAPELLLSEQEA